MNKEQICEGVIRQILSFNEVAPILEKMSAYELNDLTLYLCSYYGGTFANEFLLEFREYLVLGRDFLRITQVMISNSDHPLLSQTLFEFFFFHVGVLDPKFYYDYNIHVSHLKPYEKMIPDNLFRVGFANRFNQNLYKRLGITGEDLIHLKNELFSYSSEK